MAPYSKKNTRCLVCNQTGLIPYLNLGASALANSYLKTSQLKTPELKFPLAVAYCRRCHLAQLTSLVDRKLIFKNYAYFSSTSPQLQGYFKKYAATVIKKFPQPAKQLTLEIGSNDGLLLSYFKKLGAPILGVDPAKNVVAVARKNGIPTLLTFFNAKVAKHILKSHGPAGIIIANNVLAHTNDPHEMVGGVKILLDQRGVFVFEVQYLGDLLQKNEFDNTYHEHVCYFSLAPLVKLLTAHQLKIFDVEHVAGQGGSLRVYASHSPLPFTIKPSVKKLLKQEKARGLYLTKTYLKFGAQPKIIKKDLLNLLKKLKNQGKKIVGYGASAKGNTLLQFCGINSKTIIYIVDEAPSKQGKYTPGSHIPIVSPAKLKTKKPDYVIVLAWNYADSIIKKEAWLKKSGTQFIVPIPHIRIR